MNNYFVTGATGAVGAALVPMLLDENDTRVFLLIRAENKKHLESRVNKLIDFWEYGPDDQRVQGRITPLIGDITFPNFGLPHEIYEELSYKCTHIIHSAGNVRMNLSLDEARISAVGAAKTLIEFARLCQKNNTLQKVEYVSTIGVSGRIPGLVPEEWILQNREYHNTYEQAKAEAELVVRDAVEEGMPVTVHRPSMVVGDSRTGKIIHFQIFYHICEFLAGRRTYGFIPRIEKTKLDIVPVDYVARAIACSKSTHKTVGCIFHECSGHENSLIIHELRERIQRIFTEKGLSLPRNIIVPVWLFKGMLPFIGIFVSEKIKKSMKALPVFFDYLQENQKFDNVKTIEWLKKSGLALPNVENYLKTVLGYYLACKKKNG